MKKAILIMFGIVAIFTATDSLAYSNECVKKILQHGSLGYWYAVNCYDEKGNHISFKSYLGDPDSDGIIDTTAIFTYNLSGKQTSAKYYVGDPDHGGILGEEDINTYDTNGNLTSESQYLYDINDGGKLYSGYAYIYDENQNPLLDATFEGEGHVDIYDENGEEIAYEEFSDGNEWLAYVNEKKMLYFPSISNPTANDGGSEFSDYVGTGGETQTGTTTSNPSSQKTKRLYYTPAEAAAHVNHTNKNRIIFTFK